MLGCRGPLYPLAPFMIQKCSNQAIQFAVITENFKLLARTQAGTALVFGVTPGRDHVTWRLERCV